MTAIIKTLEYVEYYCECDNLDCIRSANVPDDLARRLESVDGSALTLIVDGCDCAGNGEVVEVGRGYRVFRSG